MYQLASFTRPMTALSSQGRSAFIVGLSLVVALASAGVALASAGVAHADERPPKDLPACPTAEDRPAVRALVRRIEQTLEGRSSIGTLTMTIATRAWSRKLRMKVWTRGRDRALVRILEGGPRETGMMTLKRDKQLWNYLPQAGRVMKLPAGMLGDSWMGSDFTNDDLVRGSSIVNDFDTALAGTATHDGRAVWRLTLTPRPQAVVVWGRIDMLVDRATCLPLVQRFYDEEGALARTMTFGDLRKVGWRQLPARIAIKPAEAGRETVVHYDEIGFDMDIAEDTFSLHRLQRGR